MMRYHFREQSQRHIRCRRNANNPKQIHDHQRRQTASAEECNTLRQFNNPYSERHHLYKIPMS